MQGPSCRPKFRKYSGSKVFLVRNLFLKTCQLPEPALDDNNYKYEHTLCKAPSSLSVRPSLTPVSLPCYCWLHHVTLHRYILSLLTRRCSSFPLSLPPSHRTLANESENENNRERSAGPASSSGLR